MAMEKSPIIDDVELKRYKNAILSQLQLVKEVSNYVQQCACSNNLIHKDIFLFSK